MLNADELAFIVDHSDPVGYIVEEALADTMQRAWDHARPGQAPRLKAWIANGGSRPSDFDDVERLAAAGRDARDRRVDRR